MRYPTQSLSQWNESILSQIWRMSSYTRLRVFMYTPQIFSRPWQRRSEALEPTWLFVTEFQLCFGVDDGNMFLFTWHHGLLRYGFSFMFRKRWRRYFLFPLHTSQHWLNVLGESLLYQCDDGGFPYLLWRYDDTMIDSSMVGSLKIVIQTKFKESVFHAFNSIILKKVLATMTHTLNIGLEFIYSEVAAYEGISFF